MHSTKRIALTIATILVMLVLPHSGLIPVSFGYVLPVLLIVWACLRYSGEKFSDIGFSPSRLSIKSLVVGTVAGLFIFSFLTWLFFPLLEKIVALDSNLADFNFIRGNTANYIFLLAMGWIVGGVYEELVFHGFIFTRLEKLFSGRYALTIAFVLTNLAFAFYHLQLGAGGVVNALLAGSAYHVLSLYHERNLWYGIICHGVFDTIGITFIYAGYW